MSMSSIQLGSKRVFLSQAYDFAVRHRDRLVGHEQAIRTILAASIAQPGFPRMAVLLVGPSGVGKTDIAFEIARRTGKKLFVEQGNEDCTAEDNACYVRFSDDPSRKMDYTLSPLATAMLTGNIVLADELGKKRARALAPLASVLDDRRYLDSSLLGERIVAHPGFLYLATTNAVDLAADGFPEYIRSRIPVVIHVAPPERHEIAQIVRNRFPRLSGDDLLMTQFWRLWDAHRGGTLPSPRDTLQAFALAMSLADYEAGASDPSPSGQLGTTLPRHLEEAFMQLFVTGGAAA